MFKTIPVQLAYVIVFLMALISLLSLQDPYYMYGGNSLLIFFGISEVIALPLILIFDKSEEPIKSRKIKLVVSASIFFGLMNLLCSLFPGILDLTLGFLYYLVYILLYAIFIYKFVTINRSGNDLIDSGGPVSPEVTHMIAGEKIKKNKRITLSLIVLFLYIMLLISELGRDTISDTVGFVVIAVFVFPIFISIITVMLSFIYGNSDRINKAWEWLFTISVLPLAVTLVVKFLSLFIKS